MKPRTADNVLFLVGQAERKIRAQGRPLAPRGSLMSALHPAAKAVTKAVEQMEAAEELREEARALVREALEAAEAAVAAVVGAYIAAAPASPRWAELDPRRFIPVLADAGEPAEGETEPASEAS